MKVEWKFYSDYSEDSVKMNASSKAGVYLLWVKLQNGNWRCFYAGKAEDLKKRLLDHLSSGEQNECIKTNVSKYTCGYEFAEVGSESDRKGIEKFLYDHYKPECNQNDPGGTPTIVNLP